MTGPERGAAPVTHSVEVEPRGITLNAYDGEAIMGAAQRCGFHWPTLCNGDGTCSICWVEVKAGEQHLSPMQDSERETLELLSVRLRAGRAIRLACQARVEGDITVWKAGVRPRTAEEAERADVVDEPLAPGI